MLAGHPRACPLLKLDLQGAEFDALAGLGERLADVEAIVAELSLAVHNAGAPLLHEATAALAALGFVLAEITQEHRHRDGSLLQIDGLFLRPASPYRPQLPFWS